MAGIFNVDLGTVMGGIGTLAKDLRAAITGKEPISAERAAELAVRAQEIEVEILRAENTILLAQAEINKVEAANPSLFVSGWRPAIGWVCSIGLAVEFVLAPIVQWGFLLAQRPVTLPTFPTESLMGLVVSMLGLAAYRTYEKKAGVTPGRH